MLTLRKPSDTTIREFLAAKAKLDCVRTIVNVPPAGYVVDHTRVRLGTAGEAFVAAKAALVRWEEFRLGWLQAWPPETPLNMGEVVAVVARVVGFWWLNACRIIHVAEEDGPVKRFGFTYATLPDHVGTGMESFLIEWDRKEGGVWYDILAFSRPRHFLARVLRPVFRILQKRFGRESAAAMLQAVAAVRSSRSIPDWPFARKDEDS